MSDEIEDGATGTTEDDWGAALDEQGSAADDWGAAFEEQAAQESKASPKQAKVDAAIAKAEMPNFDGVGSVRPSSEDVNLNVILDIPVTIAMEIGRSRISIRHLLQLNQGSVVELDRLAGEPLDVLVNGTLIAHGEVVVVNEKYGIRMTDVVSQAERVRKLQ